VNVSVFRAKDLQNVTPDLGMGSASLTTHLPVGAAAIGRKSMLAVGTRDTDDQLLYSTTTSGIDYQAGFPQVVPVFSDWDYVPDGGTTFNSVAAATTIGTYHLFSMGGYDRAFYWFRYQPEDTPLHWAPITTVPGGQAGATAALAISGCRGNHSLCLFDSDPVTQHVVWNVLYQDSYSSSPSLSTGTWTGWNTLSEGLTDAALGGAIASHGDLAIFAKGIADRRLYYNVLPKRDIPPPPRPASPTTTTTTTLPSGCPDGAPCTLNPPQFCRKGGCVNGQCMAFCDIACGSTCSGQCPTDTFNQFCLEGFTDQGVCEAPVVSANSLEEAEYCAQATICGNCSWNEVPCYTACQIP
jgi:hypothetical protein